MYISIFLQQLILIQVGNAGVLFVLSSPEVNSLDTKIREKALYSRLPQRPSVGEG